MAFEPPPMSFSEPSAVISPDELYRYALWRPVWAPGLSTRAEVQRTCVFIMLNPSTADALQDDPTIRRCRGFAARERCAGLVVVNLFALRETHPSNLQRAVDIGGHDFGQGPDNGAALEWALSLEGPKIAGWGAAPPCAKAIVHHHDFRKQVWPLLSCLGTTQTGAPRHPLYLRSDAPLVPWRGYHAS